MEEKKILYVGGFELPDKNAAAHRVIGNAKAFRELRYMVDFLGVSKTQDENPTSVLTEGSYQGFRYWSIPYPKGAIEWIRYISYIEKTKIIVSKSEKPYDVIIIYNFPSIASYRLLRYCKKNNIKIISDCTEWYDHSKNSVIGIIKHFDSEFRMRYINKRMDGVICISEYLYKYYKSVKSKIILTPLVDLQDIKWEMKRNNINHNIRLIYAGSPGSAKDKINLVIDSLTKIDNIDNKVLLNIIGITKDEYLRMYPEQKNKSIIIDKFIIFHGRIPHIDAVKLIKESDFTIFLREKTRANMAGFPTKFVESISCGAPVITNKTSDLQDYLEEGKNGFWIDMEDEKIRIEELKEIINLPRDQIETMKESTRNSKLFDYRGNVKLIDRFIRTII